MIAILKLFRFPLVFTAIADSAAGYALGGGWSLAPRSLGLLGAASSGLYFFGMALNDIADRERDRTQAPGRVLPSGRLSLRRASLAAGGVLALSLAAVLLLPGRLLDLGGIRSGAWPPLVLWAGLVLLIVGYDCVLKIPPLMGGVRALNFMMGAMASAGLAAGGGRNPGGLWWMALPPLVYVTSLTFVSTFEEGEGGKPMLWAGAVLMSAAAFLPEGLALGRGEGGLSPFAWGVSLLLAGLVLGRAWGARTRRGIMLLVRDGVGGIILLDSIILLSAGRSAEAWIVFGLVVPAALSVAVFKRIA